MRFVPLSQAPHHTREDGSRASGWQSYFRQKIVENDFFFSDEKNRR
jgi:hypothetical protein